MGFFASRVLNPEYRVKYDEHSSHGKIRRVIETTRPGRVFDVGCANGELSEFATSIGHQVTATDISYPPKHVEKIKFIQSDLDKGVPTAVTEKFDLIICADVLEHLRTPDTLLHDLLKNLEASGKIVASIPNFGHWYPRIRVLFGKFDYDSRGILDQTHLRFFTRKSFIRMANTAGYDVTSVSHTGIPFEIMLRGAPKRKFGWSGLLRFLALIDRSLCRLRSTLFAYQFIFELKPKTSRGLQQSKR